MICNYKWLTNSQELTGNIVKHITHLFQETFFSECYTLNIFMDFT